MKSKICWPLILSLCLIATLIGHAQNKESFVSINKISIQPRELEVRIVLEADSVLPILKTYYSRESPRTIIIEWDKVKEVKEPKFTPEESSLIQNIGVEKTDNNQLRLLLHLKEQVPYRIISDQKSTVIELIKIQRALRKYVIGPEARKSLEREAKPKIILKKIDVLEKEDRIDVIAMMSNKAIANVFALDNPLRLIVDLLETEYTPDPSTYRVNKVGVKRIRAGQFQEADPMISRIVFDLAQPKFYELNFVNNKLVVSFLKEAVYQAVPQISAPPQEKPEEEKIKEEAIKEEKGKELDPEAPEYLPPPPAKKEPTPQKEVQEQEKPPLQVEKFTPKTITEEEEEYSGEIMTLKFKDADLRDVILYLGEFAELNVIFDPEVSGRVTCDLVDVPWDQALDIFLKINKLGKTLEGNVLRIASLQVLTQEQEQQRRLRQSKEMAGPVQVETITLSYSKARDVKTLLTPKLSAQGEITVDDRTNTLIISDVKEKIELLEKLVSVFDTPTPQVSIEARIVEANSNFIRNLGIQWGFRGIVDPFYGNQTSLRFPNKILADGSVIKTGMITKGIGGPLGGYAVNLPAPSFNTVLGISLGNVLDTFRIDLALTALETTGEGRIISCPKVTTQNNMQAEIIQGRQIPVQTVANFTVSTRYVNAALELQVTPQITAEGTVIMTIEIRNNAADFANLVNGIPPITTQSARTTVMVNDGGTTVIGGIYRTEDSVTREGVPFLQKIPILGGLFRSMSRTRQNRELLIFITPRILK